MKLHTFTLSLSLSLFSFLLSFFHDDNTTVIIFYERIDNARGLEIDGFRWSRNAGRNRHGAQFSGRKTDRWQIYDFVARRKHFSTTESQERGTDGDFYYKYPFVRRSNSSFLPPVVRHSAPVAGSQLSDSFCTINGAKGSATMQIRVARNHVSRLSRGNFLQRIPIHANTVIHITEDRHRVHVDVHRFRLDDKTDI